MLVVFHKRRVNVYFFNAVLVDDAPRTSAEQPFCQSKVVRPWKAKHTSMSQTISQIWGGSDDEGTPRKRIRLIAHIRFLLDGSVVAFMADHMHLIIFFQRLLRDAASDYSPNRGCS